MFQVNTLEALVIKRIIDGEIEFQQMKIPPSILENLSVLKHIKVLREEELFLKLKKRRLEESLPEAIRKFNLYQDLFNVTTLDDIDYVNEVGVLSIKYEKSLKNIEKMVFECGNRLIERNKYLLLGDQGAPEVGRPGQQIPEAETFEL